MNRKLKRYLDEEERTVAKIAELQEHLKEVRIAKKQEEDTEIIRSIRGMKLDGRALFSMLNGIQDGAIDLQDLLKEIGSLAFAEETPDSGDETEGTQDEEDTDAMDASESEDEHETEE